MKILVVHRQKEVLKQIKSVLRSNTSIIRFSDSGLDGLLAARIESFDLIICNTDLPVITGYELVRSIKTNSMNKNTPSIFLVDQKTDKMDLLGSALGITAIIGADEVADRLLPAIEENVRPVADVRWEDLLSNVH
jgi:CheY-like chemotaxis protein